MKAEKDLSQRFLVSQRTCIGRNQPLGSRASRDEAVKLMQRWYDDYKSRNFTVKLEIEDKCTGNLVANLSL